jgi:Single-strand binding protein family
MQQSRMPSARRSRRTSAQSSTSNTCFLPSSVRARVQGKLVNFRLPRSGQFSVAVDRTEIMNETTRTLTGNLTADPELRFTPAGANFTVAATSRIFEKTTNQWRNGEALFLRCTLWRHPAENLAESLHRGDRVIVTGRLRQRWTTCVDALRACRGLGALVDALTND